MLPLLRAAADQLIYDIANVEALLEGVDDEGLALRCEATGWSVSETIAHLAHSQAARATALEGVLAGEDAAPSEAAGGPLDAAIEDTIALYREARDRTIASFALLTASQIGAPFAGCTGAATLAQAVRAWAGHPGKHALDLLEAIPAARADTFVLNWALYQTFPDDEPWLARRRRLFEELRKLFDREKTKPRRKKKEA